MRIRADTGNNRIGRLFVVPVQDNGESADSAGPRWVFYVEKFLVPALSLRTIQAHYIGKS
jgi:hypothetical protein